MENNNNKLQVKTVVVWVGLFLLVISWGMTIQATLSNVRLNEKAIERLDELKADKVTMNAQIAAMNIRLETLKETMNVYLKHIDEKLADMQKTLEKLAIKEDTEELWRK